jgi:SAM-dependent methyltransferase
VTDQATRPGVAAAVRMRLKWLLRRGADALTEAGERFSGRRDPLVPPARLMFVGGSRRDFRELGDKWLQTFIRVGGLRPDERVLDVGCGVGRMAVALSGYLNDRGRYEGFDIVREGIEWCQRQITPRFPRFRFHHADLFNKGYNPGGRLPASAFRFPYEDASFDLVLLTSVFTHMLPPDVERYLSEIRRVLAPGGRCLITFFVLDDEARRSIASGQVEPMRRFTHDVGGYFVIDPDVPEATLAYAESAVRRMFQQAGLTLREPIEFGGWGGASRARTNHSQDIVVAERT